VFVCLFVCFWRDGSQWARASSLTKIIDYTQRRTTVGRTSLDEWSARRRNLYLTTRNTHNKQTSMTPEGFEPTISAGERPQTYVYRYCVIVECQLINDKATIKFVQKRLTRRRLKNIRRRTRYLYWTKCHWDRVFSEYFGFPPPVSFQHCSILNNSSVNDVTVLRNCQHQWTTKRKHSIFAHSTLLIPSY
jgi:hypothetical protein